MKTKIALTIGLLLSASASVIVAKDAPMFVWNRTTLGMVEAASAGRGGQIAEEQKCAKCHGKVGISEDEDSPNIAGQKAAYIKKQLADYKAEAREEKSMTKAAKKLNPQDIADLGAFYAAQKLIPEKARNKDTIELGQRIFRAGIAERGVAACAGCHGPRGEGIPAQFPALAGQYADYTDAQLRAFRSGARANDPNRMMRMTAARLSDAEIKAVADYIAGLR